MVIRSCTLGCHNPKFMHSGLCVRRKMKHHIGGRYVAGRSSATSSEPSPGLDRSLVAKVLLELLICVFDGDAANALPPSVMAPLFVMVILMGVSPAASAISGRRTLGFALRLPSAGRMTSGTPCLRVFLWETNLKPSSAIVVVGARSGPSSQGLLDELLVALTRPPSSARRVRAPWLDVVGSF